MGKFIICIFPSERILLPLDIFYGGDSLKKILSYELVVFMDWTGKSMNNHLSYGLVDARISVSEKDLPVTLSKLLPT